ncbi:MAG: hypothetical protein ABMB14_18330 [Myxococcota bacterium]
MIRIAVLVGVSGCAVLPLGGDDTGSETGSVTPSGGTAGGGDYDALVAALDANKSQFGGEEVGEMYPAGDSIYWLEYRAWDPTLHGLDTTGGAQIDYAAPLRFDSLNVRVDAASVAYAELASGKVVYHLYDSAKANRELTTVSLPAPTDGTRWYAYANDGTDLYYVTAATSADPKTRLFRVPEGGEPEQVTTLESAGAEIGEFWDFGVDGDTMVFIESGRIWSLDLASNRAEWLGNQMQVQGTITFTDDGVLFTAYDGTLDVPWFFDTATRTLTNVAESIAASTDRVPGVSAISRQYQQDITRWRDWYVYVGNDGVFAFHPDTGEIVPVLLEPRSATLRIEYRYPVVTDNGRLYVTGLESESGSVGADGPIWEVDLAALLD